MKSTTPNPSRASIALLNTAVAAFVVMVVWFFVVWLPALVDQRRIAFYDDCFRRGGTITEGGAGGRACVGITRQ